MNDLPGSKGRPDLNELAQAYAEARKFDPLVLAEQFVGGGEYTVALLEGRALPAIKIEPATEFVYDAKYFRDDTVYRCPAGMDDEHELAMRRPPSRACRARW